MTSKILLLLKPFQKLTFEVKKPERELSFNKKLAWTFGILVLYLVLFNTPLFGIPKKGGSTPLYVFRTITASESGSLAELGIMPIITAVLVMQLLVSLKIIKINHSNSEEKKLYNGTLKLFSILATIVYAALFVICGAYGELDIYSKVLVVFQLIIAGIVIILMDELIQKGYGFGTGTSLFILTNVCYRIFYDMFALIQNIYETGSIWYRGAVLAFFQGIRRGDVMTPFFRPGRIPDFFGFIILIVILAVLIFIVSIRIEIPIHNTEEKKPDRYPISLFYTSYIPVLLTSTLFAGIYMISNLLWTRFGSGWAISLSLPYTPTAWYVAIFTPPYGPEQVIERPLISLGYLFLMILFSGIFSLLWVKAEGLDSKTLVKQLLDSDLKIPSFREKPEVFKGYLDRNVPITALWGGLIIGALAGIADLLGPLGTGTGVVIMMFILKQYSEIIVKEKRKTQEKELLSNSNNH